jgi:chemosensory pili system protein ChpA (sensor histidine kinase/response regulator)
MSGVIMADRHDYVALEWVKGEIAETLKQARLGLESFVASPDDSTAMDACLDAIHQVHGSLQMIEFYGAALLAEEIEQLALALQQDRVGQHAEAVRLLTFALGQLPVYLDRIHSARRDLPLVVLPLLNDLRSARGESLLSETSLFAPQLLSVPELDAQTLARRDSPELPTFLRKLRQTLQTALVGLLREQDLQTQLGYMTKVFARLELLCKDAPLGPLWRIASALVETMASGNFANSPALRSLFKDADKELKRLLDQGIVGINQPAPDELLKSLLFYIAKSDSQAQKMLDLKDQYGLADALPHNALVDEERARMAGPDRDAMRSVIVALCDELVLTKERLDVFVRGDRQHVSELSALLPPLRQIADTLAVLGFGQPRKEATLAGMAGTVDQSSREQSRLPTTDLSQIHQLVIKEARVVLQQAKDVIVDYIDGEWDRERLAPLSALLVQVRGALAMIPLARASGLLSACNDFILEHLLVEEGRPAQPQLDSLAEAITGVEYYLERMAQDPEAPGEHVLDLAQASLAKLGYSPALDAVDLPVLEEVISDQEMLDLRARQALVSPTQTIAEVLAVPVRAVNPPARYVPASLLPPPTDEEAVDEELRDVFLEETDEMLAALHRYLPRWFADTDDFPALTEIRRAFHTLKGSGRMVRALILGELAWSVENLLNRVLEDSVEPGPGVLRLLADVQVILPDVIRDFAEDVQRQRDDVDVLAARAHALSRGLEPMDGDSAAENTEPVVEAVPADGAEEGFDPQLLEIFRQEAQTHLETLNRFTDSSHDVDALVFSDELLRALHTLKGSAYMAGVLPMAELASPLDQLVREFKANQIAVAESEVELLRASEPLFRAGLAQLDEDPLRPIPGATQLIEAARALLDERLATALSAADNGLRTRRDPKLIEAFLAEGMDILLDAEGLLKRWRATVRLRTQRQQSDWP